MIFLNKRHNDNGDEDGAGMPKYVGKKLSVVIPPEVFEVVEKLATKDSRSNSMMVVILVKEALKARGIELDDTED